MADVTARFGVVLEDDISGASGQAASSLEQLQEQINADTAALGALQKALRNLRGATTGGGEAMQALKDKIAIQQAVLGNAQAAYVNLGGKIDGLKNPTNNASNALQQQVATFAKLNGAAALLPGPLGAVVAQGGALQALFSGGMLGAIIAVTAALAALAVGLVAVTVGLFTMGVSASGAARDQLLLNQALLATTKGLDSSEASAGKMAASVNMVASQVALAKSEVQGFADNLVASGLQGNALTSSLRGVSIAASAAGPQVAASFQKQYEAIAKTGGSVDELTAKIEKQFGAIAEAKALSFGNQIMKLKENLSGLFTGLRIEGLLRAFKNVTDMFNETSAVGGAIKTVFETLFQPMVDGAASAVPLVKRFIQGIVIAALNLVIIFLKVKNSIRDTFGGSELFGWFDSSRVAVAAGVVVFGLIAAAIGVAAVSLGLFLLPIIKVVAIFGAFVAAGYFLGQGLAWLADQVTGFVTKFIAFPWGQMGSDLVAGIVNGITGAAGAVWDAVSNLAKGAMNKFKSVLGISSPSKVFTTFGLQTGEGAEVGLKASAPKVHQAMEDVATPPKLPALKLPEVETPKPKALTLPDVQLPKVNAPLAPNWEALKSLKLPALSGSLPQARAQAPGAPASDSAPSLSPKLTLERATHDKLSGALKEPNNDSAPSASPRGPASRPSSPGAKGASITFAPGSIVINTKSGDAKAIGLELRPELTQLFKKFGLEVSDG